MIKFLSLLSISVFAMSVPVMAADAEKAPEKVNPVVAAAEEFTADFDDMSKRHFGVLYGNYNMTKVVESVRDNIENTADKCGDVNPDMEDKMDARFEAWEDAVEPVLDDADANINNMIVAQDYAKPRDIRKFFKMIDKERKEHDKEVQKIPVTTPEACQHLLDTMDKTQDNMIKLLRATLVSLPQAMQEADDEAKEKAEKEAAEEAEEAEEKEAQDDAEDADEDDSEE